VSKNTSRQKHLKKIRERREEKVPARFKMSNREIFLRLYWKARVPLSIILTAIALFIGIDSYSNKERAKLPKGQILPVVQAKDEEIYRYRYPLGFQLIEITRTSFIIPRKSYLPKDFKIDWANSALESIKDGFVKMKIAGVSSRLLGITDMDLQFMFAHEEGTTLSLIKSRQVDFRVEVLKVDGANILCVLGLRPVVNQ
jgi:hypothetical protein